MIDGAVHCEAADSSSALPSAILSLGLDGNWGRGCTDDAIILSLDNIKVIILLFYDERPHLDVLGWPIPLTALECSLQPTGISPTKVCARGDTKR